MGKKKKEKYKVTMANLVEAWGITRQAIEKHISDGHLPSKSDGGWDWPEINHQMLEHYRKMASGNGATNLTDERVRLTRINADRREFELAKDRGEWVHAATEVMELVKFLMKVDSKLQSMPVKSVPIVMACQDIPEGIEAMRVHIDEVRREISDSRYYKQKKASVAVGHRTGTGVNKAKTSTKHQRMGKP